MNLIIDASNIFHRSFWMASKSSTPREDENLSFHAFIFLRSLKSYVDKFAPASVYCVWDKNVFRAFAKSLLVTHTKPTETKSSLKKSMKIMMWLNHL